MSELAVAEQFFSIQGEGRYSGQPSVFLRLAGCNLLCGAVGRNPQDVDPSADNPTDGATWVCDTIDVWREADQTYSPEELVDEWRSRGWLEAVGGQGAHIVLTGGEPTLPKHQEAFVEFEEVLREEVGHVFVEVETNGTIKPSPEFDSAVDQYNVSLKLRNSGHSKEERINPEAIEFHDFNRQSDWKFVVGSEDDIDEIKSLVDEFDLNDKDIMLMPAGMSQDQLRVSYPMVAELCKETGWKFTGRRHVDIYDMATSV